MQYDHYCLYNGISIPKLQPSPWKQQRQQGYSEAPLPCRDSLVTKLFAMNNSGSSQSELDDEEEDQPYAEFWMGSHVSGPSFIVFDGSQQRVTLKSWLLENPNVLGPKVVEKWGGDLPFLFKVWSYHIYEYSLAFGACIYVGWCWNI